MGNSCQLTGSQERPYLAQPTGSCKVHTALPEAQDCSVQTTQAQGPIPRISTRSDAPPSTGS